MYKSNFAGRYGPVCFPCGKRGRKASECQQRVKDKVQASCLYSLVKGDNRERMHDRQVELTNGDKTLVLNAVILSRPYSLLGEMPVVGTVSGKSVTVLQDTGSNTVVMRRSLVEDDQLTGENHPEYLMDGSMKMLPKARVYVETPHYRGMVTAFCMKKPLYDLILGNAEGVKRTQNPAGKGCCVSPSLHASLHKWQNTRRLPGASLSRVPGYGDGRLK